MTNEDFKERMKKEFEQYIPYDLINEDQLRKTLEEYNKLFENIEDKKLISLND